MGRPSSAPPLVALRMGEQVAVASRAHGGSRLCQLVWFDPGVTTGAVVVAVRARWLAGDGDPGFTALRRAISTTWAGQVGANPRVWSPDGHAITPPNGVVVTGDNDVRRAALGLSRGRSRRARVSGPEPSPTMTAELAQLAQCVELLDLWPDAAWGYEDFVPMGGNAMGASSRDFLSPVRLFSALAATEIAYGERGRVPFTQMAAMAKSSATDERLREAGLYRAGMPHATDAARHAVTFLRRARASAELREAAWPRVFTPAVTADADRTANV